MQKRSPIAVALLPLVTFGIYGLVWYVKTKREMVAKGADIPTSWLLIVPLANIYWVWKYSQGVEHVTNGKQSAVLSFVLLYVIGSIGAAIIQDGFNNIEGTPSAVPAASPMSEPSAMPASPVSENPSMPAQPIDPSTPPTAPQV